MTIYLTKLLRLNHLSQNENEHAERLIINNSDRF